MTENVKIRSSISKSWSYEFWKERQHTHLFSGLRPAYKITKDKPGSDLAAETAAALASASFLLEVTDPDYAEILLEHAEKLYKFAVNYPGIRFLRIWKTCVELVEKTLLQ